MKNNIVILHIIFLLASINLKSQTIINTENMMSDLKDDLSYNLSFQGDFNFGNIELIQFSTAHQFSKKIGKNQFRLLFNYDYINESNEILASDFTGQLRYNYSIGKNSVFAFAQGQNIKSIRMKHRYISGGGYRHHLFSKSDSYFDLSAGIFFEDELYDESENQQLQIYNWRYSLSAFGKYAFTKDFFLNLSVYYQINTSNTKDYRLFLQPRIYYSLKKVDLFIDSTYRFHSTPYIDVLTTDTSFTLGIEYSI
ncbi:DUF481 domain-containing protein [Polaribacter sp.]|uniref:DUF481 domain-containing protein n=1 Tax=Polaribacter sp. TaxID=1920175 RepID=UPI0025DBCD8C|nr:DUF481 domain-containing protein [Polaribacter sp.]